MVSIRPLLTAAATIVLTVGTAVIMAGHADAASSVKPSSTPAGTPARTPARTPADQGVTPLHCSGHPHSNIDHATNRQFLDASNVNIRTFPHTACTSVGLGQITDTIDEWCFGVGDTVTRNGESFSTWTYIQDETRGTQGWVSDAFMDVNSQGSRGSLIAC